MSAVRRLATLSLLITAGLGACRRDEPAPSVGPPSRRSCGRRWATSCKQPSGRERVLSYAWRAGIST